MSLDNLLNPFIKLALMAFQRTDCWVWDFWLADDGEQFHMFYLHAPRSLGDPHLRHRNARIGHATSRDLVNWEDHGRVFEAGAPGSFDETATWTGSVVLGGDGLWRMFYTGARFLSPQADTNIQSVGVAVSEDLFNWTKRPGPICTAHSQWYEALGTTNWPEEAWRDPWVYRDPRSGTWHMLITARANEGDELDRGVIGHAVSRDLSVWEVHAPRSRPGAGFAHLEVPQILKANDKTYLIFCCDAPKLSGRRKGSGGGIWCVDISDNPDQFPIEAARRIADDRLYAGRIATDRNGKQVLLAFVHNDAEGKFAGYIADPIAVDLEADEPISLPRTAAGAT